jgi:hypothetical protein
MSSYLPMHLQIVDFDCKNYNGKCGYYKKVVTFICNLIQTHDDDKPLTPNVDIAIVGFFWQRSFTSTLDHLMQYVLNLIKE